MEEKKAGNNRSVKKTHTHRREYVAHTSASGSHFSEQFIQQEDNDPNKLKGLRPVKLVTGL